MMIITLDHLANRYHCLPSEAIARATTFDLFVMDTANRYVKRQQDLAAGRPVDTPQLSQTEMRRMIDLVRRENGSKS